LFVWSFLFIRFGYERPADKLFPCELKILDKSGFPWFVVEAIFYLQNFSLRQRELKWDGDRSSKIKAPKG
jgi:hypothetical protein